MAINFLNVGAFPDDVKLTFGAGSDLQIFHNATDSIIYNGTGALMLRGSDVRVQAADASATYLTLGSTGATFGVHLIPSADNTIDLGTTDSKDFRTLYIRNIDVYNQRIYIDSSGTLARFYDHPTVGDGIQFLHLGTEILRLGNGSSTTATFAGNISFTSGSDIIFPDNLGAALEFKEGSNLYMRFVTTNGGEAIQMEKATTISNSLQVNSLTSVGDIMPSADSTYNLGSSGVRWANAYIDGLSVLLTATIGGNLLLQSTLQVLNKAQTSYLNLAARDTSGAEVVYNLSNIGTINGNPIVSGSFLPLAGGTMTGDTDHGDSVYNYWGASNDLQIYHDGTDSYVSNISQIQDI